jgi:hypothetical protein
MSVVRRLSVVGLVFVLAISLSVSAMVRTASAAPLTSPPSRFCHSTDGSFTSCPDGSAEWSDVQPGVFAARHAYLYSDQADLVPDRGRAGSPVDTLMLMYDECGTTRPLGPNEYFLVSFDSVETDPSAGEHLERYNVHVFADGTIVFLLNGRVQTDPAGNRRVAQIDGQRGRAGFGASPNCSAPHLTVEYHRPGCGRRRRLLRRPAVLGRYATEPTPGRRRRQRRPEGRPEQGRAGTRQRR